VRPGAEAFLTVRFSLAHATPWAPAGHVVAWDQLALPGTPAPRPRARTRGGAVRAEARADAVLVRGRGVAARIGRASGLLESLALGGRELLAAPLAPNFWRVPTDADLANGYPLRTRPWKMAGLVRTVTSVLVREAAGGAARIEANLGFPTAGETLGRISYTVSGDGRVEVEYELVPRGTGLPEIPRIGLQTALPARFDRVRWFGRGPQESYWDRRTGAAVGLHAARVEEMVFPFARPQENGNRSDVRWVEMADGRGDGLRVRGAAPFNFSAWPYTQTDLELAAHPHELPRRPFVTLNVDLGQMGLGGDDAWGAWPHPEYRLTPDRTYVFRFAIERVG
jgi:beta-galactosidase